MKQITTILLLCLVLMAAKCQEPDIDCYSVEYVDSLLLLNTQNCSAELLSSQAIIDSLENHILSLTSALEVSELTVFADTFNFEITDDRLKVEINKIGYDVWVDVVDGDKRINSDYINSESKVLIMNDTTTIGSLFINATNTKGTSYIEL